MKILKTKIYVPPILHKARNGMVLVNDLIEFAAHFGSIGLGVFAVAGTTASGRGASFVINVDALPLSLRFVISCVIAAAMGWLLGALVSWLTRDQSEKHNALGLLVALVTAGLFIFSAEWLANPDPRSAIPELELFAAFGLLVAFWVTCFNFRMHAEGAGVGVLKSRASALFTFAGFSALLLILTQLGAS